MNEPYFEEHLIHGTAEFPVGIYDMCFNSDESSLFPLHYHSEFEFLVITRGEVKLQRNGEATIIKQGEGAFISSGTLHSAIGAVMSGNIEIPRELPDKVVKLVREANEIFKEKPFGYELFIKAHLTEMLAVCIGNAKQSDATVNSAKTNIVKTVLDYIHANYAGEITLNDLASHVHISKEHLCRIFREVSDYSPIVYLNRYRIIRSAYMLRSTTKSISQISSECGFNNSSYFNKQFMRFMKCSPTKYRKNNK